MKPKHQRMIFVAFTVVSLCVATLLVMNAFRQNLVFFYSPSELALRPVDNTQLIRIGGLVEAGSIERGENDRLQFRISDGKATLTVMYQGMVPALFREGQGAVAEGYLDNGEFHATRILTKHDENYMPREVVDALKKSGRWKQ